MARVERAADRVNRPRVVAFATLSASVGGVALAALLMGRFGVWAVPIGRILAEAVACYVVVPRDCCRQIRADYGAVARQHGLALLAGMGLAGALAWMASQLVVGPSAVRWLVVGLSALAGSVLPAWRIGLHQRERDLVRTQVRALLDRRPPPGRRAGDGDDNHRGGPTGTDRPASHVTPPAPPGSGSQSDRRVAVVAHHPFWMFDHAREIRRRGWDVSLFTATPRWMVDTSAADRVTVQLGWATWVQALRRLGRLGIHPPRAGSGHGAQGSSAVRAVGESDSSMAFAWWTRSRAGAWMRDRGSPTGRAVRV